MRRRSIAAILWAFPSALARNVALDSRGHTYEPATRCTDLYSIVRRAFSARSRLHRSHRLRTVAEPTKAHERAL